MLPFQGVVSTMSLFSIVSGQGEGLVTGIRFGGVRLLTYRCLPSLSHDLAY